MLKALQQQPHKEVEAQLSPDLPQVADSSFSQKSDLALSTLPTRNLGQAPSVVNNNGVFGRHQLKSNLRDAPSYSVPLNELLMN